MTSLEKYQFVAIWLEGIALVAILIFDVIARNSQHKETVAQMSLWRKQIHADRVAHIFVVMRKFHKFIIQGVHFTHEVGPGKDFSDSGDYSNRGGIIFQEYLDLQEALYLSKLVSDSLFSFMKDRIAEADGLQRVPDHEEFHRRLQEFNRTWDVYNLATTMRDLY